MMALLRVFIPGIVLAAYSPLGSPDRPFVNQDDPMLLDNPVLKKVADKHKSTPALVSYVSVVS